MHDQEVQARGPYMGDSPAGRTFAIGGREGFFVRTIPGQGPQLYHDDIAERPRVSLDAVREGGAPIYTVTGALGPGSRHRLTWSARTGWHEYTGTVPVQRVPLLGETATAAERMDAAGVKPDPLRPDLFTVDEQAQVWKGIIAAFADAATLYLKHKASDYSLILAAEEAVAHLGDAIMSAVRDVANRPLSVAARYEAMKADAITLMIRPQWPDGNDDPRDFVDYALGVMPAIVAEAGDLCDRAQAAPRFTVTYQGKSYDGAYFAAKLNTIASEVFWRESIELDRAQRSFTHGQHDRRADVFMDWIRVAQSYTAHRDILIAGLAEAESEL